MEIDKEEFKQIGYQLIDKIAAFINSIEEKPITTTKSPEELNIIFNTFQNEHDGVAMWSCITCGMCTGVCPQNIEYVDYVLEQRIMSTEGTS